MAERKSGFTIIEVMLVLAVSAALAVGILAGSGRAVEDQRYRDSVNTTKSFIQEQYNLANNPINGRSGKEKCSYADVNTETFNGDARGTTDCLLLGRILIVSGDGSSMSAGNVIGYRDSVAPPANNDVDELKNNYVLKQSPLEVEDKAIPWDARIVRPAPAMDQAMPLTLMIIRSPLSGSMLTFVNSDSNISDPNTLVRRGINAQKTDFCIVPAGLNFPSPKMAVRIQPYATTQSAIEVVPENEGVCRE